ncbi:MAG: hypothetical protein V5B30_02705 [Candidatus Accumulibacter delftensis]
MENQIFGVARTHQLENIGERKREVAHRSPQIRIDDLDLACFQTVTQLVEAETVTAALTVDGQRGIGGLREERWTDQEDREGEK